MNYEELAKLMIGDAVTIVLADDDDGHASLIERNLRRCGIVNPIIRATNGKEVLDFVDTAIKEAAGARLESLIFLLDINMPEIDGVEVLRRMKSNQQTAHLPCIMLTTTDDPREIERCYQIGCNVYVVKPVDYEAFIDAIRKLGMFLQVVRVPENRPV